MIDLTTLRQRISIVELARAMTPLKRVGSSGVWRGVCPCCGTREKSPFLVEAHHPRLGPHFKCFRCHVKGDVFNLWAIERFHDPHVKGERFVEVVRSLAARYGIAVPEDRPRVASSEAPYLSQANRVRDRVTDAWTIAHDWMVSRARDIAGTRGVAWAAAFLSSDLTPSCRTLGYVDEGLSQHLAERGVEPFVRRAARLDDATLARLAAGWTIARTQATRAVGLSARAADGTWGHIVARDTVPDPAYLLPVPHVRPQERHLVVALDFLTAGRVAAAVREVRASEDRAAAKAAHRIGLLMWDPSDLSPLAALQAMTERALIIAAPPEADRAAAALTAQLAGAGLGVRVATLAATADPTEVVRSVTDAPHALDWQWQRLQAHGAARDNTVARVWIERRVEPVLRAMDDPVARAVFEHRARRLAGSAARQ